MIHFISYSITFTIELQTRRVYSHTHRTYLGDGGLQSLLVVPSNKPNRLDLSDAPITLEAARGSSRFVGVIVFLHYAVHPHIFQGLVHESAGASVAVRDAVHQVLFAERGEVSSFEE